GDRDGRIALYLTDSLSKLWRPPAQPPELSDRERRILELLQTRGASFFASLHQELGGGFPGDAVDALWNLVWKGLVTNDTFRALRAFARPPLQAQRRAISNGRSFRSRRVSPPSAEGRWSLLEARGAERSSPTEWGAAYAQQLLARYGLVTREVGAAESIAGGFSAVYDVFKILEESGRIRRGYFVTGVGAMQFALPTALDLLRSLREMPDRLEVVHLAATDPANPYGAILPWPTAGGDGVPARSPSRSVGAYVILVNGAAAAYLSKGGRQVFSFLPEDEPDRSAYAKSVAFKLAELGRKGGPRNEGLLIGEIDGAPAKDHPLSLHLVEAGFSPSSLGFLLRKGRSEGFVVPEPEGEEPHA
ncbi:MAG TPA: DEAD/DEAH box helicase, partial [Myxococcaceae bacterium]|nr:DEAD/DEAH box helicase [Myxococcaceae bacterium]